MGTNAQVVGVRLVASDQEVTAVHAGWNIL